MASLSLPAALLLAACAASAQSAVVIPYGFARKEAPSSYGSRMSFTPSRHMFIYAPSALKGLSRGTYRNLALRRDGLDSKPFVKHTYKVSIWAATRGVPSPAAVDPTSYARNAGKDYTRIFQPKAVQFPADPRPINPPAPFTVKFPLDRPILYLKPGGPLLLDFLVESRRNQVENNRWAPDCDLADPASGKLPGTFSLFGKGCPQGLKLSASVPPVNGVSRLGIYWYSGGGYNTPAFVVLGNSNSNWAGTILPLDLRGIGAPGCHAYCNGLLFFPGRTDPNGTNGRYRVDILPPHTPALAWTSLYAQVFVLDKTYNPAGIRASEGLRITLGSFDANPKVPYRALYTYRLGAYTPIPDKPKFSGFQGLVVQFTP